ncbi:purine-nucleoside phosphorylase [Lewinella cohaerens]|uniref:purine-nucleoside phosphorylase n=1 Tax=Lewinella cohaerens TaxID=70995 RepID=UPI00036ECF59|nr:purine-nucleoside phosphorylase [Lewinella cohaerens]
MPSPHLYDTIQDAVNYLKSQSDLSPRFGLILGTGLSGLADEITDATEIAYGDIPHFPVSTVQSHRGKLIFGKLAGIPIVAMAGRFHYYEGYSMEQVTFPVRVMKFLGIERLIISNASGSVNPAIEAGDIVFVRDHINFMADNPLRGHNDERLGPRFPDMLGTYDRQLNTQALQMARKMGIPAHEGIYLGLQGPNLETPAEYQFFHRIGADLVGMSTVPEVLVAKHMELPIFVVSVVSNKCYPLEDIKETSVEDVIAKVGETSPRLQALVKELIVKW